MLTTVKDPETLKYFYRSYKNQGIEFVDLKQFDHDAKEIKTMKIERLQKKVDVSLKLK